MVPVHYREYYKIRNKVRKLTKLAKRNWESNIADQTKKIQNFFENMLIINSTQNQAYHNFFFPMTQMR